jgi:hypothetical protein
VVFKESGMIFHVYGETEIVIAEVLAALLTMYVIDSRLTGDHEIFIETLRFLIYRFFKLKQNPNASYQEPLVAPKLVVLLASNTPIFSIAGE